MFKALKIIFLIFFLLALLLFLGSFFVPVSWLVKKIPVANITPQQVEGYWWRGSIKAAQVNIQGLNVDIEVVSWDHDWRSFLSLELCHFFVVRSADTGIDGRACFRDSKSLKFSEVSVKLPAQTLADITGLEIAGDIEAFAPSIIFSKNKLTFVRADALWQLARFYNGKKWIELGEISITLDKAANEKPLLVHWTDFSSPAVIDIKTYYQHDGSGRIAGYIEPNNLQDPAFVETLQFFSQRKVNQPAGNDRYIFDYSF